MGIVEVTQPRTLCSLPGLSMVLNMLCRHDKSIVTASRFHHRWDIDQNLSIPIAFLRTSPGRQCPGHFMRNNPNENNVRFLRLAPVYPRPFPPLVGIHNHRHGASQWCKDATAAISLLFAAYAYDFEFDPMQASSTMSGIPKYISICTVRFDSESLDMMTQYQSEVHQTWYEKAATSLSWFTWVSSDIMFAMAMPTNTNHVCVYSCGIRCFHSTPLAQTPDRHSWILRQD